MPTRPVSWELDIPPANLGAPANQSPPAREVPSIDKLRSSLMGTRFELLKISTFAAFLLAFVGVAIHGSHLTNPDNEFVANTGAALKGLSTAVSSQTASIRSKTQAIALAAAHEAEAAVDHATGSPAPVMVAKAEVPATHSKHSAHHAAHEPAPIQVASLEARHSNRHHRHEPAPTMVASAEMADPQWSGNLLDLPDFVSAEGSKASHRLLDVMQGGIELSGLPHLRSKGEGVAASFGSHFDVTNPGSVTFRDPSSIFQGLISPDSLLAAMAALLLYMIFVVVLVQIKGGLRALAGSQAAV